MKILHVVESFGGGVASAIFDYATSTGDMEHYLVRTERSGAEVRDSRESDLFSRVDDLGTSLIQAIQNVRRLVQDLQPNVVHAHSSHAGLIARIAALSLRQRPKIVYTPHCFAFERQDVPRISRLVFWMVECIMAGLTDVYATCSERERDLALRLRRRANVVVVPNTATALDIVPKSHHERFGKHARILGSGRLTQQKDPKFFAEVYAKVQEECEVAATWVGGGEKEIARHISSLGISLSGWVDRPELLEIARSSDIYVHTAAWEGMPVAFLEFHRLGLPMVVRRVESMPWIPSSVGGETVEEIAELVNALITSEPARIENVRQWDILLSANTPMGQRRALRKSYLGDSSDFPESEVNSVGA